MDKTRRKTTAFAVVCLMIGMTLLLVPFGDNEVAATGDGFPLDIMVSDVTNQGFTVSWMTEGDVTGYLEVNVDGTWTQFNSALGVGKIHYVPATGLAVPATTYEWRIVSDGVTYQDDGTSNMGIGPHNQEYNPASPGDAPWTTMTRDWTPTASGSYTIFVYANDEITNAYDVPVYIAVETAGGGYSNVLSGVTDGAFPDFGGQVTINSGDFYLHTATGSPTSLLPDTGDYIKTRANGGQWDGVSSSNTGVAPFGSIEVPIEYPFDYPGAWAEFDCPLSGQDFYTAPDFGGPPPLVLGPYSLDVPSVDIVLRADRGYQMIAVTSTVSIGTASEFASAIELDTGRHVIQVSDFSGGRWVADWLHRGADGELLGMGTGPLAGGDFALQAGLGYLIQLGDGAAVTWLDAFPVLDAPVAPIALELGWNNVGAVHTTYSTSGDILGIANIDRVAAWDVAGWTTDPGGAGPIDLQTCPTTSQTYLPTENAHGFFVRTTAAGTWDQSVAA